MAKKGSITRKQFLTGGASMLLGAIMRSFSEQAHAEQDTAGNNVVNENDVLRWDEIPLDIMNGAFLVANSVLPDFGGTIERDGGVLTQYIPVYPGMEIRLSNPANAASTAWIGYTRERMPIELDLYSPKNRTDTKSKIISIPSNVYLLRGSSWKGEEIPRAWVRNFPVYVLTCGLNRPDLSSYTEITALSVHQYERSNKNGSFDKELDEAPALGDVFFTPIGSEIVLTFNNACIAPYIHVGKNFNTKEPEEYKDKKNIFDSHYGFGYAWYYYKTKDECSWLGAFYEAINGCVKVLTKDELLAAEPHLYIKFPSVAAGTQLAARARTEGVTERYERLFTAIHVTDTHGDADSTHAAFEYADAIGANFIALTGDYVQYRWYHGYNILHTMIKNAKTPSVYSLGNHDVADTASDQEAYEINIAPIREALQASEKRPYYYRDLKYGEEVVRVISLYPFFEGAELRDRAYYSEEQLAWLCDVLASTPDEGHIFILRHFSHHRAIPPAQDKTMFYDYGDGSSEDGVDLWLNMRADPITGIIDAYNERTPIFAKYIGLLKGREEIITVNYDFSHRKNSEFVAYFTGHIHNDCIGYARNTKTKQAVLCSLCTTGVRGTQTYGSFTTLRNPRDYGTDSQIAFNVFAFDFEKKLIHVARVGNGGSKDHKKTYMFFSYA